jgi:hypothetical protein
MDIYFCETETVYIKKCLGLRSPSIFLLLFAILQVCRTPIICGFEGSKNYFIPYTTILAEWGSVIQKRIFLVHLLKIHRVSLSPPQFTMTTIMRCTRMALVLQQNPRRLKECFERSTTELSLSCLLHTSCNTSIRTLSTLQVSMV